MTYEIVGELQPFGQNTLSSLPSGPPSLVIKPIRRAKKPQPVLKLGESLPKCPTSPAGVVGIRHNSDISDIMLLKVAIQRSRVIESTLAVTWQCHDGTVGNSTTNEDLPCHFCGREFNAAKYIGVGLRLDDNR